MASLRLALPLALLASASSIGGALLGLAMPARQVQVALGGHRAGHRGDDARGRKSEFPQVERPDALSQALAMHGIFVDASTGRG
jgi:hypothetical protein